MLKDSLDRLVHVVTACKLGKTLNVSDVLKGNRKLSEMFHKEVVQAVVEVVGGEDFMAGTDTVSPYYHHISK